MSQHNIFINGNVSNLQIGTNTLMIINTNGVPTYMNDNDYSRNREETEYHRANRREERLAKVKARADELTAKAKAKVIAGNSRISKFQYSTNTVLDNEWSPDGSSSNESDEEIRSVDYPENERHLENNIQAPEEEINVDFISMKDGYSEKVSLKTMMTIRDIETSLRVYCGRNNLHISHIQRRKNGYIGASTMSENTPIKDYDITDGDKFFVL